MPPYVLIFSLRACLQGLMDDLRDTLVHEPSMATYSEVSAREEPVVRYVKLFHDLFGVDYDACPDKISALHRRLAALTEQRIQERRFIAFCVSSTTEMAKNGAIKLMTLS